MVIVFLNRGRWFFVWFWVFFLYIRIVEFLVEYLRAFFVDFKVFFRGRVFSYFVLEGVVSLILLDV